MLDTLTESDLAPVRLLQNIQTRLFEAGRRGDLASAERIINDCAQVNIRAIDILLGLIAPMLYRIGEDWRRGAICVAEEHRFTRFCEKVFDLLSAKLAGVTSATRSEPARSHPVKTAGVMASRWS
jgi:methanogenic corrinoid protein MtbC1